jgi:hypothetical protein
MRVPNRFPSSEQTLNAPKRVDGGGWWVSNRRDSHRRPITSRPHIRGSGRWLGHEKKIFSCRQSRLTLNLVSGNDRAASQRRAIAGLWCWMLMGETQLVSILGVFFKVFGVLSILCGAVGFLAAYGIMRPNERNAHVCAIRS